MKCEIISPALLLGENIVVHNTENIELPNTDTFITGKVLCTLVISLKGYLDTYVRSHHLTSPQAARGEGGAGSEGALATTVAPTFSRTRRGTLHISVLGEELCRCRRGGERVGP